MKNELFRFGRADERKLKAFGFEQLGNGYRYTCEILGGQFRMTVMIRDGKPTSELIDTATDEPYTLHLYEGASGDFVGNVRSAYESVLDDIANACYVRDEFPTDAAHAVIEYAFKRYGDELEFLWEKFTGNAVLRRKDSGKWYAALLTVQKRKIGLAGEEEIPVLDVRAETETIERLVDGVRYFRGYHMNKKHWLSMLLDGTVEQEELISRLDDSYLLAKK